MDPNVTLRPADKMTVAEWRAERAERARKEHLYELLKKRLAWHEAHPYGPCGCCGKRVELSTMVQDLCQICHAWASEAVSRLSDFGRRAKLRIQLVATELLGALRAVAITDLASGNPIVLPAVEDAARYWERVGNILPSFA